MAVRKYDPRDRIAFAPALPKLHEWIVAHGMERKDFAARAGISRPHFSHIILGRRVPSLAVAVALFEAADREIPIHEMLAPHFRRTGKRKKKGKVARTLTLQPRL